MPFDGKIEVRSEETVRKEESYLRVIRRARGLIAKKRSWCTGEYARTYLRLAVEPESRIATRWCASGALRRAVHDQRLDMSAFFGALMLLDFHLEGDLIKFNDSHGHEAVIGRFDKALMSA